MDIGVPTNICETVFKIKFQRLVSAIQHPCKLAAVTNLVLVALVALKQSLLVDMENDRRSESPGSARSQTSQPQRQPTAVNADNAEPVALVAQVDEEDEDGDEDGTGEDDEEDDEEDEDEEDEDEVS